MERTIAGYYQDDEGHWVADLGCGHAQHVRHNPPARTRPWVLSTEGRAAHLGTALNCVRCDREVPHHVIPAGPVRFYVEFFHAPSDRAHRGGPL